MTTPQAIFLKDYQAPIWLVEKIDLEFDLGPENTVVTSQLKIILNNSLDEISPCFLHGENLKLKEVFLNGEKLAANQFQVTDSGLKVFPTTKNFTLKTVVEISPEKNTALEGLYISDGAFCTQNEPEGFRKITYYIDRPDNMSVFSTKIIADKKYPYLLANGNLIEKGELPNNKHFAVWKDPFKKPSYLFALVAGDLDLLKDTFTTKSGRKVALEIYVDKGNLNKADYAMKSLKNSMKWDEDRFGLEYDLDIYMIVAVDAFNMGAMENKGLNIFNSQYVLANPQTATDQDFEGIEGVIGHEYFHNWTGNRVTCRDWFQLTLKEGLTVFRDQEFSADMTDVTVKRIQDVKRLREFQFKEDQSPMSHPIKPKSYIEMNNFYTATVYEKGAEVIRMIQTLIGRDIFRKGMDKYFELHDGQAVTTEDFVHAMELASGKDLTQFRLWYDQHGTPEVKLDSKLQDGQLILELTQSLRSSAINDSIDALHIPLLISFYSKKGQQLNVKNLVNNKTNVEFLMELREKKQTFKFEGDFDNQLPVISINRNFSAPINLIYKQSSEDLCVLISKDHDYFNRYQAMQEYMSELIYERIDINTNQKKLDLFLSSFEKVIKQSKENPYYFSYLIDLPSQSYLNERLEKYQIEEISKTCKFLKKQIGLKFEKEFVELFNNCQQTKYEVNPKSIGTRKLRHRALNYLLSTEKKEYETMLINFYHSAQNMTDELFGLEQIVNSDMTQEKINSLEKFISKWKDHSLVVNKWLAVQATSSSKDCLENTKKLENHPLFDFKNPNKVRSLIGAWSTNLKSFHQADGSGYKYLADKIIQIDKINPQIASRLSKGYGCLPKLDLEKQKILINEVQRVLRENNLSRDSFEVLKKIVP